jgi:hypothetical protein
MRVCRLKNRSLFGIINASVIFDYNGDVATHFVEKKTPARYALSLFIMWFAQCSVVVCGLSRRFAPLFA